MAHLFNNKQTLFGITNRENITTCMQDKIKEIMKHFGLYTIILLIGKNGVN